MATRELTRPLTMPTVFEDIFKPFNEFFDMPTMGWRVSKVPHVNIIDRPNEYQIELAAPGFKKEDFNIDVSGNYLTISLDKEDEYKTEDLNFTKREYNYYNFTRSFTIPEDVVFDTINAKYENGILKLLLPKKEEAKKVSTKKHINVL
jgi:HSP20 family protein